MWNAQHGRTPLYIAFENRHNDAKELLLAAGANVHFNGYYARSQAFQRVLAQIREDAAAVPLPVYDLLGNKYELHGWAQQRNLRMLLAQQHPETFGTESATMACTLVQQAVTRADALKQL